MVSKNVLITGSSSGIGAQIALTLSNKGYNLFLTGRNEEKLKLMKEKTGACGTLAIDLKDNTACEELATQAQATLGHIDILINNAGQYVWSPIEKTKPEDISTLLKLNLEAPYNLCRLCVKDMKNQKWGRIINIGSISGAVGEANASLYSMTKAGLAGMTKSLALELAQDNITINLINPGWVKTELTQKAIFEGIIDEEEELDMIPQRRFIHPEEVADMVSYLASESAKGVTGQCLNLCAGLSLG